MRGVNDVVPSPDQEPPVVEAVPTVILTSPDPK